MAAEEILLERAERSRFSPVILRFFNAAGEEPAMAPDPDRRGGNGLIHVACRAALGATEGMELFGTDFGTADGTAVRDFVHVQDMARAVHQALAWRERTGLFVIGSGQATSARQVINALHARGHSFPVREMPGRAGEIVHSLSNPARARQALSWEAEASSLESLLDTTLSVEARRIRQRSGMGES